jgi:hypothetical protein
MSYSEKRLTSIGDTTKVELNITIVSFHTFGSLLKLRTSLIDVTGITAKTMHSKLNLPNAVNTFPVTGNIIPTIQLDVNGSYLVEPDEVAALAKHFQSVYGGSLTPIYRPGIFCSYLLFPKYLF